MTEVIVILLLVVLSFISGMLSLGVAFVAIPALGLFGYELKHVIIPWALLLNGVTAVSAAVKFMQKKMVGVSTVLCLVAAQLGAAFMAKRVKSKTLARMFAVLVIGLAAYRVVILLTQ